MENKRRAVARSTEVEYFCFGFLRINTPKNFGFK